MLFKTMLRFFLFGTFILSCLVWIFVYQDPNSFINYSTSYVSLNATLPAFENDPNFLISSEKCKIVNLNPFNKYAKKFFKPEKYKACRKQELLTYITKIDNIATLHIDEEILPSYLKKSKKIENIKCCYSNVTRAYNAEKPDDKIYVSPCKDFKNNVTITEECILVKCEDKTNSKLVYENTHAIIKIKENVQKKMFSADNTTKQLSVLIVGIDSISRLNLIRGLPNTYKYLSDNNWATLKGYNKIDDNTFPNLMAILIGQNQSRAYSVCKPKEIGKLNECPFIWNDFSKFGYVTAYGEDESNINTFNYNKKGFNTTPTDYYLRPYVIASETLNRTKKDTLIYCSGPETAGERILNAAKDFAITFKNNPAFGLFWMNSFSHNALNSPTGMDNKVKQFLEDLSNSGVIDTTVVVFLSDHGLRFGDIRLTPTGWLEERLPFIFISFPTWFKELFPEEYSNFLTNEYRLTCPYDLHMTLQHILVLSGYNHSMKQSEGCPKCQSLFYLTPKERSCEDASIAQHWCTCYGYKEIQMDYAMTKNVGNFVVKQVSDIIHRKGGDDKCAKYHFYKIIDLSLSEKLSYTNNTYLMVRIETRPKAVFETTLLYKGDLEDLDFFPDSSISRLDSYQAHSKCVSDSYLKIYCYCRK
ncbi:unnamed protein product [Brassicogethes aeneus]|uniref:Uncharacterized protein n=1 Tax=Brassicogethes aeneus TaxID=1431903 RepID=A0A9P0B4E8_BRAAE|nr:unnamed protein product [Brassicogethes aeneus]